MGLASANSLHTGLVDEGVPWNKHDLMVLPCQMKGREHSEFGEGPFSVKHFLSFRVPQPETKTSISSSLNLGESGRQMGWTN